MAKQVKIKEIAKMAGVSAGTVDRVLHKRGKVSQASLEAVERVLDEVGYRYNIHTSAISFRKTFNIAITIPNVNDGEYWNYIKRGINHAIEEYFDVNLKCDFHYYDQFDSKSCVEAYDNVLKAEPDAVIIGPTFIEETQRLCNELDSKNIPYIYVDSAIEDTDPTAIFTTDHHACGMLAAKLLHMSIPQESTVAILLAERTGNRTSNNSISRKAGVQAYMEAVGLDDRLIYSSYVVGSHEQTKKRIESLLDEHHDLKGISVLNSRGHVVAGILQELGRQDVKLISFDLTEGNIKGLEEGYITALLCQRPELQGFHAIKTLISHLLYKNIDRQTRYIMPIDVIFKENLPFYKEIINS